MSHDTHRPVYNTATMYLLYKRLAFRLRRHIYFKTLKLWLTRTEIDQTEIYPSI